MSALRYSQYKKVEAVTHELIDERVRQHAKWGEQNHADGTALFGDSFNANAYREQCQRAFAEGRGTWRHVLDEEIAEAYAESDPALLRAELLQVAAVAVAWVEAIDRRIP